MVAVAEIASGCGASSGASARQGNKPPAPPWVSARFSLLSLGIAAAWGAGLPAALANPAGGVVIQGQATFNASQPNQLLVSTQNGAGTSHSAINWQSFSIAAGSTTHFQQPNAVSTSINRVVSNTPSAIFGTLSSNGHLVLVNQAGIAVGAGALVDTAGFTASALAMSDADARSGRLRFGTAGGLASMAGINVQGQVLARTGDVVLMAPQLETGEAAVIQAPGGSVILAAGQQVEISGRGLDGIVLQVQAPADRALNLGSLQADAVGMFASTLKHSGSIEATAVTMEGGRVMLKAADQLDVNGTVRAQGLDGRGGAVHVTAGTVRLDRQAVIDVSGASAGGEALIGGGWQGQDARLSNASQTVVATGARIRADATGNGDGGTAVVWADGTTRFGGFISARGGVNGGNGGLAEVSGKQYLDFRGTADLTAPLGRAGTLLLDPDTLTIGNIADLNGDLVTGDDVTVSPTVVGITGYGSQITAAAVSGLLNSANLTLSASGNVTVNSAITKTNVTSVPVTTTLSLTSTNGSIQINAPISYTGDPLNVSLNALTGISQSVAVSTVVDGSITASTLTANATGSSAGVTLNAPNSVANASFVAGSALPGYGGSVSFKNTRSVALGDISAASLNVDTSSGNGAVTQVAGTSINLANGNGNATFTAGTGNLAVGNSNLFRGIGVNSAGVVSVSSASSGAIELNGISAGSFSLLAVGPVSLLGNVSTSIGAVDIQSTTSSIDLSPSGSFNISAAGSITLKAKTNLTATGSTLTSQASGDAVVLSADSVMNVVTGYGGSVSTPNGRALAYVNYGPTHSFGLISPVFKQYNFTTGATVLGSGNGVIYTNATPAVLTSTLTGAVTKVYDGALAIGLTGASLGTTAGAIDGDTLTTAVFSLGSGNLSDPNVGVLKNVTATGSTGMTVTGISGGNGIPTVYGYQLSASGFIGAVAPKTVTLSASKIYDGTTSLSGGSVTIGGLVSGQALSYSGATASDAHVLTTGKFINSITLSDGVGGLASNYALPTLNNANAPVTITPQALTSSAIIGGVLSKTYDGTTSASGATVSTSVSGAVAGDSLALNTSGVSLAYNNAHVLAASTISASGALTLVIASSSAASLLSDYNFSVPSIAAVSASITAKALTISGITAANKVYDGTTAASVNTAGASYSGLIAGDAVSASASGAFADKNVATGKTVILTGSFSGADAANYSISGQTSTAADITQRPLSTWSGAGGNNLWSTAGNWDALPDGANVLAVSIPAGAGNVIFDTTVGGTSLQTLSSGSASTLIFNGGALQIGGNLTAAAFSQTGGALSGAGQFKVNGSFSQSGGSITMNGIDITHGSGNLALNNLSAPVVSLIAQNGAISQTGPLVAAALSTSSTGGTVLNDAGNRISSWLSTNTGSGAIALTNVGALDVQGITNSGGDITVFNTGAISTSGLVSAPAGTVSMTANSPLAVGSAGISSSGNILLSATNLTSSGNMLLNGPITSSAGSVSLNAANNLTQNGSVFGLTGVTANVGGTLTLGPLATSANPSVTYSVGGVAVTPPPLPYSSTSIIPGVIVATFLDSFETLLQAAADSPLLPDGDSTTPDFKRPRINDWVVTEGELCRP